MTAEQRARACDQFAHAEGLREVIVCTTLETKDPEQTEGPYFVDRALERSDIRLDPTTGRTTPGVPLALRFELSRITPAGQCVVLPNAQFDIWHCNAVGEYSGVDEGRGRAADQMFLRGYQRSSEGGLSVISGWATCQFLDGVTFDRAHFYVALTIR